MALSYITREADGVQAQFDFPFGYLSKSHVFVFVDNSLVAFKWISDFLVEPLVPLLPGQQITIRRLTDRANRVTTYTDGQTLLASSLNAGDLQTFFIAQEMIDQIEEGIVSGDVSVLNAGAGYITAQWIQDQLTANLAAASQFSEIDAALLGEAAARAAGLAAEAAARAAAIGAEAIARGAAITAEAAARTAEVLALTTDLEAEAATRTADVLALTAADADQVGRLVIVESDLNTPTTGVKAKLVTVEDAITTETTARATADTAILAEIDAPGTGLKARATSLESRTTAVEIGKAEASELTSLAARVTTAEGDISAAEAAITTEATARATEDTAIAASVTTLAARVTTAEGDITAAEAAIVTANDAIATETTARATADTAILAEINDPTTGLKARATSLESRTTNVENDKAEASALTALSSEVSSQAASTNDALNTNAKFAQLHASGIVPPGWADWVGGWINSSSYAHPDLPSRYGWRHYKTSSDAANWGIGQYNYPVSAGRKYLLRATARRLSGSFGSSGTYVAFFNAAGGYLSALWVPFATGQTTNGEVVGVYPDGVHTWEAIVTTPAGAARTTVHAMTGWEVFGASVDVDMLWYECGLYASESPELAAAQAKADIVTEATTRATEDTALAASVTTLAARVTTAEGDITAAEAAIVTANDAIATETGARTTQVNALDTRVGATEAGLVTVNEAVVDLAYNKAEASTVTALTASVSTLGGRTVTGGNMLANSSFSDKGNETHATSAAFNAALPAGWIIGYAVNAGASTFNYGWQVGDSGGPFPAWIPRNITGLWIKQEGADAGAYAEVMSQVYACQEGRRYGASMYTGAHRCRVQLYFFFYNSAGAWLGVGTSTTGAFLNTNEAEGGATIGSFKRLQRFATAPVGATQVRFVIRKEGTSSGSDSYLFGWGPQLMEVPAGATEMPPYQDSGDLLGQTRKTAVDAAAAIVTESTTRANADAAAATTVSNLQASFSGRQILNGNPFFDEGPATTSGVIPPRWSNWASGAAGFVEAKPWGGVGLHVRQDSLTGTPTNVGWFQDLGQGSVRGSNKYKIRVDLARGTGSLVSSGVHVAFYNAADGAVSSLNICLGTTADTSGVVSAFGDGRRVWEQTVTAPATATKVVIYAMQAWGGFGGAAQASTPVLRWFECSISHISSETAGVTELREALSTGSSSLARLLLSVNTGTNIASIEAAAFSGDGVWNGSAITLQADLIKLLARNINFGTRTTFEDTRGTIYNVEASKRLRLLGPFGASNDLVLWYGLDSVALQSETKTNGIFAIATDGLVYLGNSSLSAPPPTPTITGAAVYTGLSGTNRTTNAVGINLNGVPTPTRYIWTCSNPNVVLTAPNGANCAFRIPSLGTDTFAAVQCTIETSAGFFTVGGGARWILTN